MKIEDCYVGQKVRWRSIYNRKHIGTVLEVGFATVTIDWPGAGCVESFVEFIEPSATAPNETLASNSGPNCPNQGASAEGPNDWDHVRAVQAYLESLKSPQGVSPTRGATAHRHTWKHYVGFTGLEAHYYCTEPGCKETKK